MNKYLSLVFLYNRASHNKILLLAGAVLLFFFLIFFIRVGSIGRAGSYMLMERAFDGIWAVLLFIIVLVLALMAVANSLNGRKSLKISKTTTGYTIRRLRISPLSSYFMTFFYLLSVIIILWGVAIASLYLIGKLGLMMADSSDIETKLALGLLRTEIGHALIPIAHPAVLTFNIAAVVALAAECARSCYLRWHNGTPSVGVVIVIIPMFLVWAYSPNNSYILMAILVVVLYALLSIADIIFREKKPKGDPFKVNKYDGFVDLDSDEEDERDYAEVNSLGDEEDPEKSFLQQYGRVNEDGEKRGLKKLGIGLLRRRYMPLGSDLEKANYFFGACVFIGIAEHLVFHGKYLLLLTEIKSSIKGTMIGSDMGMPYFWELQEHTYYGYILAVLLTLFLQAYWNYEYYNKKTKSVYVMKRLPDRKEYMKTIWIAPVMQACCIVAVMMANTMIDFCIYAFITPDIALPVDYMLHILPF